MAIVRNLVHIRPMRFVSVAVDLLVYRMCVSVCVWYTARIVRWFSSSTFPFSISPYALTNAHAHAPYMGIDVRGVSVGDFSKIYYFLCAYTWTGDSSEIHRRFRAICHCHA